MPGACAGLRVLDLSQGLAGPLATMILADFGADVVRVEAPGATVDDQPAYLFLNRGKRSITIDLDERARPRRAAAHRRAASTWSSRRSIRVSPPAPASTTRSSRLRTRPWCTAPSPGSGPPGRSPSVHADDGLVMAKAGVFRSQPGWFKEDGKPVFRASRDASYFAAMVAIQGIVGALLARDLTGRGQLVETNLLQTLSRASEPDGALVAPRGRGPSGRSGQGRRHAERAERPPAPHGSARPQPHRDEGGDQGRSVARPLADRAALLPGLDRGHRPRLDLAGRAVQGRAVEPRRHRQGGADPHRPAADAGAHRSRVDGRLPRQRQRVRRHHPDDAGVAPPSPDGRRRLRRRDRGPAGRPDPAGRPVGQDPRRSARGPGPGAGAGPAHGRGARRAGADDRAARRHPHRTRGRPARRHHHRRGRLLLRHPVRHVAAHRPRRPGGQARAPPRRPLPVARLRHVVRSGPEPRPQQHGPGHAGQGEPGRRPEGRAGPGDPSSAHRQDRHVRAQLPGQGGRVAAPHRGRRCAPTTPT